MMDGIITLKPFSLLGENEDFNEDNNGTDIVVVV